MRVLVERGDRPLGRALATALAADPKVEVVPEATDGVDVVVDAGIAPAGLERVERALESGAHWVDLCWERAWAAEVGGLTEVAARTGRSAVCAAGAFCGLTDPYVRAAALELVRVNEVQLGVTVGSGRELDPESVARLLAGRERSIRMLIGGAWSERAFFGDRRAYGFPPPVGDRFGGNVDCVDLHAFTERPVRSASVRLTVALPTTRAERASRLFMNFVRRGWISEPRAASVRAWLDRLGGSADSALAISVRGIGSTRLPVERRIGFLPPKDAPHVLSVAPALEAVLALAAEAEPTAGPCVGRIDRDALAARLAAAGVRTATGDLGGWRAVS